MLCCEVVSTIDDLASNLKKTAIEEVRKKNILGNAYILTACANPHGSENMVIIDKGKRIEIYWCGELVFCWDCGLKKYICGDWTGILSNQAMVIKDQRKHVALQDRLQRIANNSAARNYVVC